MDHLQRQLDPANFARVSRSAIVRLEAIQELRLQPDGNYGALLNSGTLVPCSRTYWTPDESCRR
jgi:two-component system, LytTR family, response regulator